MYQVGQYDNETDISVVYLQIVVHLKVASNTMFMLKFQLGK